MVIKNSIYNIITKKFFIHIIMSINSSDTLQKTAKKPPKIRQKPPKNAKNPPKKCDIKIFYYTI